MLVKPYVNLGERMFHRLGGILLTLKNIGWDQESGRVQGLTVSKVWQEAKFKNPGIHRITHSLGAT